MASAPVTKSVEVHSVALNEFHAGHGHVNEEFLKKTASSFGIRLEGSVLRCTGGRGRSIAKGLRYSFPTKGFGEGIEAA